jgi:hypothetical protein
MPAGSHSDVLVAAVTLSSGSPVGTTNARPTVELDTGFRPSTHGFGFPNSWHDMVLGVVASRGRCGGMVFAALDAFAAGVALPASARASALPVHDSPLARWIWWRQVDSVLGHAASNMARFVGFTYLPSMASAGIALATRQEMLVLFDALRIGRPVPLGLVSHLGWPHIARNHQALAYAAEFGDAGVVVRIYDPNHPGRDDVVLWVPMDLSEPVIERVGARQTVWRGAFVERYAPRRPLVPVPAA